MFVRMAKGRATGSSRGIQGAEDQQKTSLNSWRPPGRPSQATNQPSITIPPETWLTDGPTVWRERSFQQTADGQADHGGQGGLPAPALPTNSLGAPRNEAPGQPYTGDPRSKQASPGPLCSDPSLPFCSRSRTPPPTPLPTQGDEWQV